MAFSRKQRKIDALERENAALNARMLDAIIPALEQSTVAVTHALQVLERIRSHDITLMQVESAMADVRNDMQDSRDRLVAGE